MPEKVTRSLFTEATTTQKFRYQPAGQLASHVVATWCFSAPTHDEIMSRGQQVDALAIAVKKRLTLAFEREKAKRGRYSVRQFIEETPELAGHKNSTVAGWMQQTKQRLAQVYIMHIKLCVEQPIDQCMVLV